MLISLGSKASPAELDAHLARQGCEECHGGDPDETDDVAVAHNGLVADPSAPVHAACQPCHGEVEAAQTAGMHSRLTGERHALAARYGAASFEECPQEVKDGFEGECTSCHATCGDCHVSRPDTAGKGFIKNHVFQKTPSQKYQCMNCHGARIGADFTGDEETGRLPDTHFARGMTCMSCHDGAEMHAASGDAKTRYEAPGLPACKDCHGNSSGQNTYHQMHWTDLSCHVCHSQPYANCSGCHVAGQYKKDPIYQENNPYWEFKIGRSPIPSKGTFALLRHAPVVPDTFVPWGAEEAVAFSALPTWRFTSPHSIQRWTDRTRPSEGGTCGSRCHIGAPGGSPANASLFLFRADVEAGYPLEMEANAGVVVDGLLPAGWE